MNKRAKPSAARKLNSGLAVAVIVVIAFVGAFSLIQPATDALTGKAVILNVGNNSWRPVRLLCNNLRFPASASPAAANATRETGASLCTREGYDTCAATFIATTRLLYANVSTRACTTTGVSLGTRILTYKPAVTCIAAPSNNTYCERAGVPDQFYRVSESLSSAICCKLVIG